jgi:starch synthase
LDLQKECGFAPSADTPLIAMVSRLAGHKGFDLVRHVLEDFICHNDVQLALLGTGEYELEDFFASMAKKYPDKICAKLEYNKSLSKKFYAGADMFLMPSKSEPCGLAQMIASRYGTVPIVRETGGLYDTIKPYNEYTGEGNGFTFTNYNAHEMMTVMENAIRLYHDREAWEKMIRRVMAVDFSWNSSAEKYVELYESMIREA